MRILLALLCLPACAAASRGADLLKSLREAGLDAGECYRVRELTLARDEAKIYLTDGYLIFGKAVEGRRVTAVFSAEVEGGDAEVLLLPPNKSERSALAKHTGSPNMDEHFAAAAFVFADSTYQEIQEQVQANPYNKKSPEMGVLLAEQWSPVVRDVSDAFGLRLTLDLLSPSAGRKGFFLAAFRGKQLGTFDVVLDSRRSEQLMTGQNKVQGFDVWVSFSSRSFRGKTFEPEFRLHDYRIDTTIDSDLKMRCVTRVKLDPVGKAELALPFEISRQMRVTAASLGGEPAEILTSASGGQRLASNPGNDVFIIVAPRPLDSGKTYELEIRHEGRVISDAGNRVYFVGSRGSWYPNRGMQFANFDLTFRSPQDLDLVASGEPVERREEGGQLITRRVTAAPVRMAGFNLGVYERARVKRGSFTVEVCGNHSVERALQAKPLETPWTPLPSQFPRRPRGPEILAAPQPVPSAPPNPVAHLQALANDIGDVMDFYATRFGPIPVRTLEVSPVPGRFGQGFPGLIYLSTLSYLTPAERPASATGQRQQLFFSDLLYAHEAAHQWWGNIVTSAGYHDDWIMESLANYSALLFIEKRKGPRAAEPILDDYRRRLLLRSEDGATIESAGPVVQGSRIDGDWSAVVYGKGTWIIHMLRCKLGDDAFLRMLAALRQNFEDKTIDTEQFRLFCARFLAPKSDDPQLEAFFEQWVYGTGIPALKVTYSVKGAAPLWRVFGTVTQNAVNEDFSADVPVEVQMGKSKAVRVSVRASSEPATFTVAVKAAPTKVLIDSRAILAR